LSPIEWLSFKSFLEASLFYAKVFFNGKEEIFRSIAIKRRIMYDTSHKISKKKKT